MSMFTEEKQRIKLSKILLIGVIAVLIGGFLWLASTDVPIEKTEIKRQISNERFFGTK